MSKQPVLGFLSPVKWEVAEIFNKIYFYSRKLHKFYWNVRNCVWWTWDIFHNSVLGSLFNYISLIYVFHTLVLYDNCMEVFSFVANGVMHFTLKKEATIYFINSELTEFKGKCNSGLTRFDGKVHLLIFCIEDRVRQNCQGDLSVESQGAERTPLLSKLLLREEPRCDQIQS